MVMLSMHDIILAGQHTRVSWEMVVNLIFIFPIIMGMITCVKLNSITFLLQGGYHYGNDYLCQIKQHNFPSPNCS